MERLLSSSGTSDGRAGVMVLEATDRLHANPAVRHRVLVAWMKEAIGSAEHMHPGSRITWTSKARMAPCCHAVSRPEQQGMVVTLYPIARAPGCHQ